MVDTGALGGVLSDVGLGLMKGLMGPSWEEEKRERELKLQKQAEEIATARTVQDLNKAHAAYYALGKTGGGNPYRIVKDPVSGALRRYNLLTNELDEAFTGDKPEKPPTEDTIYKRSLRHAMEQVIGTPMEQWTPQQQLDPRIKDMRDLYTKRDDWMYTPTGWVRRDDPAFKAPPTQIPTDTGGATTGTGTLPEKKTTGTPTGTTSTGATAPPQKPAETKKPTEPFARPKDTPPPGTADADPKLVTSYGNVLKGKTLAEAEQLFTDLMAYPAVQPVQIASMAQAFHERFGKPPPGMQVEAPGTPAPTKPAGKAATPGQPSRPVRFSEPTLKRYMEDRRGMTPDELRAERTTIAQQYEADPKPITAHHLEAIDRLLQEASTGKATAAPPKPTVPPESVPPPGETAAVPPKTPGPRVVQTGPQQEAQREKTETAGRAQRGEYRDQARLEIAIAAANKAKEAGIDNEQNRLANDLFVNGHIDSPTYSENIPEHQKLVNDALAEPKKRKEAREEAEAVWARNRDERSQILLERQQLIDLTGKVTPEQAAITNKLFTDPDPAKRIGNRHYALNSPEDQEKVNQAIRDPKLRKEHLDALKQAQPMLDELAMLENTQYLTRQIIPLLTRANIGLGGKVTNFSNWAWNNLPGYKAGHLLKAEEQMKKEGLGPSLDKALEDARATAMMEGSDPGLMNSLYYTGGRSRLETLVALLMYSHAMAQKRIGAGTARGITTEDMKEARQLFDPADFFATPDKMYEKLVTLQQTIQRGKVRKEEEVRSYHIDPKTRNLILKTYYQEGESPGTPETAPDAGAERVRSGPRRK